MSFYVSGISDLEIKQSEIENQKQNAIDEIVHIWLSLSIDEKEGLIEAISQTGKEHKIKRLMDEQSKISKELDKLNNPK